MSQIIDLGKLRFTYTGVYSGATSYEFNDVVSYGGNLYHYKFATATTGNLPTSTTYWNLILSGLKYIGAWSNATAYKVGELVTQGGKVYLCIQDALANTALNSTAYWSLLLDGIQYEGAYSGIASYQKGDVVTYSGSAYILTALASTGNAPTDTAYWAIFVEGTFPNQVGNADSLLTTNGTSTSWTDTPLLAGIDVTGDTEVASSSGALYVGLDGKTISDSNGTNVKTVTNKALTSNVATLTTSAAHGFSPFQFVVVAGVDATFNGTHEIIDTPTTTTLTYSLTASNVTSTAASGTVSAQTGFTNEVAFFTIDGDDYSQVIMQNTSNDPNASSDFIAYPDNGTDFAGYIDLGITSSAFNDPEFTITGPNDGYIFVTAPVGSSGNGNLVLATGDTGAENKIVFAAGGLSSSNTQMEITPDVNVHIEIPTPSTSPTTGALTVVGGVGIQGDMNIAGDVAIVGNLSFGGGSTTTSNLAVSDPLVFVGNANNADTLDLGLIGEYAVTVSPITATVNNKALTSNVATLTTASNHNYLVGDWVVVTGVDATFNGTYQITTVPTSTTFTYAKTASNVSSTAVSPTGSASVSARRKFAGMVRDASDGIIKVFSDGTTKPTSSVNFSEAGLTFADFKAKNIESTGTLAVGGTADVTGNFAVATNKFTVNATSGNSAVGGTLGVTGLLTANGGISSSGTLTFSGGATFSGTTDVQELREQVVDVTLVSNVATLDWTAGNIYYIATAPSANMTFNVTNVPVEVSKVMTINVFVTQGSTGYLPTTFQIAGASQTIRWQGGTAPTPTNGASKIDVFSFTLMRTSGSTWIVYGAASTNF
jgi:hypothetical protein